MDIELIADTSPKPRSFQDGAENLILLLSALRRHPIFSSGWEIDGHFLSEDRDGFIGAAKQQQGAEGEEIGMYHLSARNGRTDRSEEFEVEKYIVFSQFGGPQLLPTHVNIGLSEGLTSIDLCKSIIRILIEWGNIQHVGICDPFYKHEDSPLDVRRRGIGWAGWLPFSLNREQVPEADVLEPLAHGTFVSCQSRWINADGESIQRAQNLELRLNSLGVLPTFDDLAAGNWGSIRR